MKQYFSIIMAASLLLTVGMTACQEKKKSDDIIIAKYVPETIKGPISLAAASRTTDVKWLDKEYSVNISREPLTSQAKIKDERGQEYVDNRIVLTITRSDNSVFLKKEYMKEMFASYLDANFRKNGILETIAFHEVDNNQLKFGVVVSLPDNDDLFIPLDMWIDRMGGTVIRQGKLFDEREEDEI